MTGFKNVYLADKMVSPKAEAAYSMTAGEERFAELHLCQFLFRRQGR